MPIELAIVADDLTGALDTSTPFVAAGRDVVVAVRPDAFDAALASGAEVVVVNTASRALPAAEAADIVAGIGARLAEAQPLVVFKKIDSRLKGNVDAETMALAGAMGRDRIVVAPAVPDQARPTVNGHVTGRGMAAPLAVAAQFSRPVVVADAADDADLDAVVGGHDWSASMAVGARGLGAAFARRHGVAAARPFAPERRTLFAFGSRDPITEEQMLRLQAVAPALPRLDWPYGAVAVEPQALPALIASSGDFRGPNTTISARFAAGLAPVIRRLRPDTLVMGGGDTALAVLEALGIALVRPQGEAAPGLPWFVIELGGRQVLRCVVKSGGFGDADVLTRLLPAGD